MPRSSPNWHHYEAQLKRRRIFLAAITWPAIQLAAALFIVGSVIWILGMIGDRKTDILGFGLVGNRGLALYVAFVCGAGVAVLLLIRALERGMMWIRPVERAVLKLPAVGPALETLALSRLARALESRSRWAEAGAAHERAGGIEEMPTRHQSLGDAARCFAEAGEVERALAIFERIETEAPDAAIPPHTRARLLELRAASRRTVETPEAPEG